MNMQDQELTFFFFETEVWLTHSPLLNVSSVHRSDVIFLDIMK